MANAINRAKYYLASLRKLPFPRYYTCPNCGGNAAEVIDRKYLITSLARCANCEILYRRPITTVEENTRFYLEAYNTKLTNAPLDASDSQLKSLDILRKVKDAGDYIRVMQALFPQVEAKVLDYGCSWGYLSKQIEAAGFSVTGYEISRGNRQFARERLGLEVVDEFDSFAADAANHGAFDIFYSSHVLEHMPSVEKVLDQALQLVCPGGYLVLFVPNGSKAFMRHNRPRWRRLWGEVHPLFLTDRYFQRRFAGLDVLLGSTPVSDEALGSFRTGQGSVVDSLNAKELVCIVRKPV
jgi:2-polyprenyl-3-methyl-5-hydroxy-6-metoxy-1,4-benzoquinol methylase